MTSTADDTRGTEAAAHAPGRRRLVHAGFGLMAFLLPFIPWSAALTLAALAVGFNFLALRRLPGGAALFRSGERPWQGIVAYPLSVLAGCAVLPYPAGAAAGWAVLAFGDSTASFAGKALGGPRLPWNTRKSAAGSVAGFVVGSLTAGVLLILCGLPILGAAIGGAATSGGGMIFESFSSRIDDNFRVMLGAGLAFLAWRQLTG